LFFRVPSDPYRRRCRWLADELLRCHYWRQ